MASISSTSSTNSSSAISSYIHGFTGLASGLDTESMIEKLSSATRSKIAAQKQKQTKLTWTQSALRNITDKIYNFTNTYTSFTSSLNLNSSKLFSKSAITALGANSSKVSVSGAATSDSLMSIARVQQLAKNAAMTAARAIDPTVSTKSLTLNGGNLAVTDSGVSSIAGQTMSIEYGGETYKVTIGDIDCSNPDTIADNTVEAINKALEETAIKGNADGKKLKDVVSIERDGNGFKFKFEKLDPDNEDELNASFDGEGNAKVLGNLGLASDGNGNVTSTGEVHLTKTMAEKISGQRMQFAYNGTAKWITLGDYTGKSNVTLTDVAKDLQAQLDKAYGAGRIAVGVDDNRLNFTTIKAGTVEKTGGLYQYDESDTENLKRIMDNSSTFAITADSVFGTKAGTSNRVNLSGSLADNNISAVTHASEDAEGNTKNYYTLSINGHSIDIDKNASISQIINKINNTEEFGVKVEYQALSNKFVLKATDNGASGKIDFDTEDANGNSIDNMAIALFGDINEAKQSEERARELGISYTAGQDAVLKVKYAGSDDEIEISRGSNTFMMDGLNISLKGTFGYNYDEHGNVIGEIRDTEEISFEAHVDSDKAVSAVKDMINAFNDIVDLVNKELTTKPNRDYPPLTDEQKSKMSESEIKSWEEKANSGLLFGDTDLRMMADEFWNVIGGADRITLEKMGITSSTSYKDNGKLVFDEDKFRAALEEDPEAVSNVLNRDANGRDGGGLLTKISSVMNKYAGTTGATKGILVTRAGSTHAPTTILQNSIQTQLKDLEDYIKRLNDKLSKEIDRYTSQFSSLETLISQMNSQSSYLSSLFSY